MPAVEQDLTQGSVTRKLVRYALPLVASSLLQAIYSITDIIIAGHYIGDVGISAINNASIIMNMLTQLAIGLTVGGNVLVGQYFGSGDHENRRKSAGNMLTVGLIAGLLFKQVEDSLKYILVIHAHIGYFIFVFGILVFHHLQNDNLAVIFFGGQKHDILISLILHGGAKFKFNIHAVFIRQDDDVVVFHHFHIIHG